LVNKNVLSCRLKDGKEVNAVLLVGRLCHARATVTRNDRSPMVLSRVRGIQTGIQLLSLRYMDGTLMHGTVCKVIIQSDTLFTNQSFS